MTNPALRLCESRSTVAGDRANVVAPPPLIFLAGLLVGLSLDIVLPPLPFGGAATTVAAAMLGATAAALAGSFVLTFRRAGTAIDPGRPSTALVTCGPYRLTRNPGYLAMAGAFTAVALATHSLGAMVMLIPTLFIIDCGVVRREERYLEAKFGADYTSYRGRVRRWL